MSRQRYQRRQRRSRRKVEEDINPMSYISNLSDVMLILAVGIMLSLVLHWKVDLETVDLDSQQVNENDSTVVTTFTDDDLEDSTELPETLERLGDVFYDPETGTYYIAEDGQISAESPAGE